LTKLIIEVRLNEYTTREGNPNIPYTAEEIAADAAACREAGASIVHFHARGEGGLPEHSIEGYSEIAERVRASCDVLLHPTLGFVATDGSDAERLAHVVAMAGHDALRPELAPLDVGSMNFDRFNVQARRFETKDTVYRNSTATLMYFAETLQALRVKPYLISWNLTFTRFVEAALIAGWVERPAFLCLCLTDNGYLGGHPATLRGLQAHLDFLPEDEGLQWSVLNFGGNLLPLAGPIIDKGGHISIGLGDYPYPELGRPTNADLVRRVAEIARDAGREIATPTETRSILCL
jgi:uncharacterized protein (DUF849 family)